MKKSTIWYSYVIITLSLLSCVTPNGVSSNSQSPKKEKTPLIKKNFIVKGTTTKIEVEIPEDCESFNDGIKLSVDAIAKYSGKEIGSFKGTYEKIKVLTDYSERIKTICVAQCNYLRNSVVLDVNESDYTFFSKLLQNYTEYQKIKDLVDTDLSEQQKDEVVNSISSVYKSLYLTKKDDILSTLKDVSITIDCKVPGVTVLVFYGNERIGGIVSSTNGLATFAIPKRYLLPNPEGSLDFKIVVSAVGFTSITKNFSLTDVMNSSKESKPIVTLDELKQD